jgi:hypothetical protein
MPETDSRPSASSHAATIGSPSPTGGASRFGPCVSPVCASSAVTQSITRLAFTPDSKWLLRARERSIRRWPLDANRSADAAFGGRRLPAWRSPDGRASSKAAPSVRTSVPWMAGADAGWCVRTRSSVPSSPSPSTAQGGGAAAAPREHAGEASSKLLRVFDLRSGAVRTFRSFPGREGGGYARLGAQHSRVHGLGPGARCRPAESGARPEIRPQRVVLDARPGASTLGGEFRRAFRGRGLGAVGCQPGRAPSRTSISRWHAQDDPSHGGDRMSGLLALDASGSTIVSAEQGVCESGAVTGASRISFSGAVRRVGGPSPDGRWIAAASAPRSACGRCRT